MNRPSARCLSRPAAVSRSRWWLSVDHGISSLAWRSPTTVPSASPWTTSRTIARRTGLPSAASWPAWRSSLALIVISTLVETSVGVKRRRPCARVRASDGHGARQLEREDAPRAGNVAHVDVPAMGVGGLAADREPEACAAAIAAALLERIEQL